MISQTPEAAIQNQRHAGEMASLYEMVMALNEVTDLDALLQIVLKQVRRVVEYDTCFITLADDEGRVLRVRAADGLLAGRILGLELPTDRGINAWIYGQGRATLVDDADADPRRFHVEGRTEEIRSAAGVPLLAGGQPIGTIYAACHRPCAFSQADLDFLTITATQVAAAVQRARLLDQAQQRAQEMEMLLAVSAAMASLDPAGILQTIYEQAGRIMDTSAFFVALYHEERDELDFSLAYEQGRRVEPFSVRLADSREPAAHVVRTGRELLIYDWAQERANLPEEMRLAADSIRSWVGVPILFQGRVFGVIGAQSREPHAFTTRQMRLLAAIAGLAGNSLQNARLYAAMQQAHQTAAAERDRLAHLHRVGVEVQRAETLCDKLQIVAEGIRQVGWGRVSVSLRDAELDPIELVCAGFLPEDEAALRANLLPGREWQKRFSGQFERFRVGQCYYLPWADPWVRENVQGVKSRLSEPPGPDRWHPQDLLYVPLYGRGGRIVGIIGLDDPQDGRRPTAESLAIVELFAQEMALVIENAQLMDEFRLVNTDLQEMVEAQAHLLQTIEEMIAAVESEKGPVAVRRLAERERVRG